MSENNIEVSEKEIKTTISVGVSVGIFSFIFIIYFIIKQLITKGSSRTISTLIFTIIIILIVVGIQLGIDFSNLKIFCGSFQTGKDANMLLLKNGMTALFIFGLLALILSIMPSWKAPFSNTIGYLCAARFSFVNTKKLIDRILDAVKGSVGNSNKALEVLSRCRQDKSVMINDMNPKNINKYLDIIGYNKSVDPGYDIQVRKLRKVINTKDDISSFIWYLLAISLVATINSNNVFEMSCRQNPELLAETAHSKAVNKAFA